MLEPEDAPGGFAEDVALGLFGEEGQGGDARRHIEIPVPHAELKGRRELELRGVYARIRHPPEVFGPE